MSRRRGLAAIVLAASLISTPATAQIEENLSSYGAANALLYLEPVKTAIGSGLADGLFASGGVPSGTDLRIRLTVQAMLISFDDEDRTFRPVTPDGFPGTLDVEAPTVIGAEAGTEYTDPDSGASFLFPGGLDLDRLGLPIPQLTVGTRGVEGTLRWFGLDTGDNELGDISFLGLGGRYEFSRVFPTLPFQVSAMVYYQKLKFGDDLLEASAFSYGVQASKRFSVLEPYAGLALDRFGLDVNYEDSAGTSIAAEYEAETNPHLTLGAALHLALVHLHGEINLADQFSVAFGLGLGL